MGILMCAKSWLWLAVSGVTYVIAPLLPVPVPVLLVAILGLSHRTTANPSFFLLSHCPEELPTTLSLFFRLWWKLQTVVKTFLRIFHVWFPRPLRQGRQRTRTRNYIDYP